MGTAKFGLRSISTLVSSSIRMGMHAEDHVGGFAVPSSTFTVLSEAEDNRYILEKY
jgi:hypothetical protein